MIRLCLSAMLLLTAWATPSFAQQAARPQVADASDVLPPDFRGQVSYFGNHSGQVTSSLTYSGGPKKDCPRPDHRCPERLGGSVHVELEFLDGEVVRGKFYGTGGLRPSELIGRRIGPSRCRLFDRIDGAVWDVQCDSRYLTGDILSAENAQVQVAIHLDTLGVRVFDYADWYRDQREQIRRKQRYEAIVEELQNGAPDVQRRFELAVELDSYGWDNFEMRPGSVRDFHVERAPRHSGYDRLYVVTFDVRGGTTGRALGHVRDKQVVCVEFDWGKGPNGRCRALDHPPAPPAPPSRPPESESLFPDDDQPAAQPN